MMRASFRPPAAILLMAGTLALAESGLQAASVTKRIDFEDLRTAQPFENADGAAENPASIELTGYMLPSDQEGGLVYEFMLVAQPGACSHVAPPPANQVVRVIPDEPFTATRIYQPVRVTGTLLSEHNKAQLYVLDGVRIVESGFRISSAEVAGVSDGPASLPRGTNSPWRFLDN